MLTKVPVQLPQQEYVSIDCVSPVPGTNAAHIYDNVKKDRVGAISKRPGYVPLWDKFSYPGMRPRGIFYEAINNSIYECLESDILENSVSQAIALGAVDCPRTGASPLDRYSTAFAQNAVYFAAASERICKRRISGGAPAWERVGLPRPPVPSAIVVTPGTVDAGVRRYRTRYYNATDDVKSPPSADTGALPFLAPSDIELNTGIVGLPFDVAVQNSTITHVIIERQYANGIGFYEIYRDTIANFILWAGMWTDTSPDVLMIAGSESLDTWRPSNCHILLYAEGYMYYMRSDSEPALCEISPVLDIEEIYDYIIIGDYTKSIVGAFLVDGKVVVVKQDGIFSLYRTASTAYDAPKIADVRVPNSNCVCNVDSSLYMFTVDGKFVSVTGLSVEDISDERLKVPRSWAFPYITYSPQTNEVMFTFQLSPYNITLSYHRVFKTWRKYYPTEMRYSCVDNYGDMLFQTLHNSKAMKLTPGYYKDGIPATEGMASLHVLALPAVATTTLHLTAPIVYASDSIGVPVFVVKNSTSYKFLGFTELIGGTDIILSTVVDSIPAGAVITVGAIHSIFGMIIAPAMPNRSILERFTLFFESDYPAISREMVPPMVCAKAFANKELPSWDYLINLNGAAREAYYNGVFSESLGVSGVYTMFMVAEYMTHANMSIQSIVVYAHGVVRDEQ